MSKAAKAKLSARINLFIWTCAGLVCAGYGLTNWQKKPVLAMVAITLIAAFYGARALSVRAGLLRGIILGAIGGTIIVFSMNKVMIDIGRQQGPPATQAIAQSQPAPATTQTTQPTSGPTSRPWVFNPDQEPLYWVLPAQQGFAYVAGTVFMSVVAAGLFAHVAAKRKQTMAP